jgi:uncharacterized protein
MSSAPSVGTIGWVDLTVPNASEVRDFYKAVVGWTTSDVAMGDYSDFCMHPSADAPPVAGVCHARGPNADLPSQWMIYLTVADLDASIAQVKERGGRVLAGPKNMGGQARYCVIQDPAGAVAALYCAG